MTGAVLSNFGPGTNATVNSIVATVSTVYFGGAFTVVGSNSRVNMAAASASNGAIPPWVPTDAGGEVEAMVISPDQSKLVIGGSFTSLDGSSNPGYGLGAVDATTGALLPWAVNSLIRDGGSQAAIPEPEFGLDQRVRLRLCLRQRWRTSRASFRRTGRTEASSGSRTVTVIPTPSCRWATWSMRSVMPLLWRRAGRIPANRAELHLPPRTRIHQGGDWNTWDQSMGRELSELRRHAVADAAGPGRPTSLLALSPARLRRHGVSPRTRSTWPSAASSRR